MNNYAATVLGIWLTAVRIWAVQYYITPDGNSLLCPDSPCQTLTSLAQEDFPPNMTGLVFLPGIHLFSIPMVLKFHNMQNLTLTGGAVFKPYSINALVQKLGLDAFLTDNDIPEYYQPATVIKCLGSSGFAFVNITNLTLTNLTFENCGAPMNDTDNGEEKFYATVLVANIYHLVVEAISITNSSGFGFVGVNLFESSVIRNSSFIANNLYSRGIEGGNAVFYYVTSADHVNEEHQLTFSTCLFSLGSGMACRTAGTCAGGGLTLFLTQEFYSVNVSILNTTSYRNYGISGANFNFLVMVGAVPSQIVLQGARSISGISGTAGGGLIYTLASNDNDTCILANRSAELKILDATFINNTAANYGSAAYIEVRNSIAQNCFYGLNVRCINNVVTNHSNGYGVFFVNNTQERGPGVKVQMDNAFFVSNNNSFRLYRSEASVSRSIFTRNAVTGVQIYSSNVTLESCHFFYNSGEGSISAQGSYLQVWNSTFIDNRRRGTDSLEMISSNVTLHNCMVINNTYLFYAIRSNFSIINCTFNNNAKSSLTLESDVYIKDSVFSSTSGTALSFIQSNCYFTGNNSFENNTSDNTGGAIVLSSSIIYLVAPARVDFLSNYALISGGAIYVTKTTAYASGTNLGAASSELDFVVLATPCFFSVIDDNPLNRSLVTFHFARNKATFAGDAIYGGNIDSCKFTRNAYKDASPGQVFDAITSISQDDPTSVLSSDAIKLCLCNSTTVYCDDETKIDVRVYPGQSISLNRVAVGQRRGIVPSPIVAFFEDDYGVTRILSIDFTSKSCSVLNYTITSSLARTNSSKRVIQLATTLPSANFDFEYYHLDLNLEIVPCPFGFQLDEDDGKCTCRQLLQNQGCLCDINTQSISRPGNLWVGNTSSGVLTVHPNCPLLYCKSEVPSINFSEPDAQCDDYRTGILCGRCKEGFSSTFGTSKCRNCSNSYLGLLVLFTFMGILLVVALFLFNLTVTNGSVCALIYYGHIVKANDALFFPTTQSNGYLQLLHVFISWLNVDFGVNVCFYDGMDIYAKTWLQFVFPIYLCIIVAIIILLGRYSLKIAQLCKHNALAVLCTLVLLSYSKLLRTVIIIFSSTKLLLENSSSSVWLYDGNIQFLEGKHIPLFVVGLLVSLLFLIPYTGLLLFATCLQKVSHLRGLKWTINLKPFIDVYHAPFKDRFRPWTGWLLLARIVLFIIFAGNVEYNPSINFLAIIIVEAFLMLSFGFLIHKRWPESVIEAFFHINLLITSAGMLYVQDSSNIEDVKTSVTQSDVTSAGVGLALLCFACIFMQSVFLRLMSVPRFANSIHRIRSWIARVKTKTATKNSEETPPSNQPEVTMTVIAQYNDVNQSDDRDTDVRLREPALSFSDL